MPAAAAHSPLAVPFNCVWHSRRVILQLLSWICLALFLQEKTGIGQGACSMWRRQSWRPQHPQHFANSHRSYNVDNDSDDPSGFAFASASISISISLAMSRSMSRSTIQNHLSALASSVFAFSFFMLPFLWGFPHTLFLLFCFLWVILTPLALCVSVVGAGGRSKKE